MSVYLFDDIEDEDVADSVVLESEKTAEETASLMSRMFKTVKETTRPNSVAYEHEYGRFVFSTGINNFQVAYQISSLLVLKFSRRSHPYFWIHSSQN